jgi:hypothetical protein
VLGRSLNLVFVTMADAMLGGSCWRCRASQRFTYFVAPDEHESTPFLKLCKPCVLALVRMRDSMALADVDLIRTRRNFILQYVVRYRHGVPEQILLYDSEELNDWLLAPELTEPCALCGAFHGYNLYDPPSWFPILAACRSCIKHIILDNRMCTPSDHNPFDHVVVNLSEHTFDRLFFGEDALIVWLAADEPWVEVMRPAVLS